MINSKELQQIKKDYKNTLISVFLIFLLIIITTMFVHRFFFNQTDELICVDYSINNFNNTECFTNIIDCYKFKKEIKKTIINDYNIKYEEMLKERKMENQISTMS